MITYIMIGIIGYCIGIFSILMYSIFEASSECSKKEESKDFGQVAYEEIEKREKNKSSKKNKKK